MNNVYIAEIQSIFPKKYAAEYLADKMYPSHLYGDSLNKFAKKLAYKIGVKYRASVLDYELFPINKLALPSDHPKLWGTKIINELTKNIDKNDIGFFGLNYNLSFHTDILPNLSSQIIMDAELANVEKNEELVAYGCAASIYSLKQAVNYCNKYDRPAITFSYDQRSKIFLQLDKNDEDFNKTLITNLLFTDGGIGLLIIPERMRKYYKKPLLKITDIQTKYKAGNLVGMKNGRFLMSKKLKDVMPKLVSDYLMKPFLTKNQLDIDDIDEWSMHQGGTEVIKQFCNKECLNLSEKQIERSLQSFKKNGNTSTASCLLVLESFFNEHNMNKTSGSKGIMFSFGTGYYLGALLYEWDHYRPIRNII